MNGEIAIQRCSYLELLDSPQSEALLAEYAVESSIAEIGPVNPSREIYAMLEEKGALQCFIARRDEQIVGFGTVLVSIVPHYSRKVATIESLFVPSACRRMGIGGMLMREIEHFARESGCEGILYSAPAGGKLERVLDTHKSYQRTNSVFYRSLN